MASTSVMTGAAALTAALALAFGAVGGAAVAAQRVSGAADGAALAAADALSGFAAGDPCARAGEVAAAHRTRVVICEVSGRDATIVVEGSFGAIPVRAASRAGPPPGDPDPAPAE